MRVQLMTAMAVCLTVSACSGSKAPAISLDSKLKCSLVADAKMQGDNGTVVRLVNSAFEAAASDYKGDSDIEYYFQNAIRAEPATRSDVQRAVMNQCIADTGASISETFRKALTDSYEKNADKIYFASCKAFNDGKFGMDKIRPYVTQAENSHLGSVARLNMDSSDPKWTVYEESITSTCKADPSKRLDGAIRSAVFGRSGEERATRQQAEGEAIKEYRLETTRIISELDSLIKNNNPIQCVMLKRIEEDRRPYDETASEVTDALRRAHEATLAEYSLLYAAAVRKNLDFSTLVYNNCADDGLSFAQRIEKEFGPDTQENALALLEGRFDIENLTSSELELRNDAKGLPPAAKPVEEDLGSDLDEGEEMQMNRASRADMEDALYKERQVQEQSN